MWGRWFCSALCWVGRLVCLGNDLVDATAIKNVYRDEGLVCRGIFLFDGLTADGWWWVGS